MISLVDGFVELSTHRVVRGGIEDRLTISEAKLLRHLWERSGDLIPQETLLTEVFGYREGARSRTVANTMRRLRKKIEAVPSSPVHLTNEYGRGYRFEKVQHDAAPSGLFGRSTDILHLHDLLHRHKVAAILGPGGIGKSTLARAYGTTRRDLDVVRCAASSARSVPELEAIVARTLGLREDCSPEALGVALAGRGPLLLFLDAVEGVAGELASTVEAWHGAAPRCEILMTSRSDVTGVRGLALRGLSEEAAAAFFLDKAGLERSSIDEETLFRVLSTLGGIPLAIQLAAARIGVLSLSDLATGSRPLMRLLSSTDPHRHGSMQAALRGSWEVLTPEAKRALIRCTTFAGDFDIPLAEAVIGGPDPLSVVASLRETSWLDVDSEGARMLDPLRAFVREQAQPHDLESAERGHAISCCERAQRLELGAQRGASSAMNALRVLLPDLRKAFENCSVHAPIDGVRLAIAVAPSLRQHARSDTAMDMLDRALALASELAATSEEIELLMARARVLNARLGPRHGLSDATAAVALTQPHSHERGRALTVMGILLQRSGDLEAALKHLDESVDLLPLGSEGGPAARVNLGQLHHRRGAFDQAQQVLTEVLPSIQRPGYERLLTVALSTLSRVAAAEQRWEEAEGHALDALNTSTTAGDTHNTATLRLNLGVLLYGQGRAAEAVEQLESAYADNARIGSRIGMAHAALNLAIVEVDTEPTQHTRTRLAFALTTFTAASHQGALAAWSTLSRLLHTTGTPRLAVDVLVRALAWEAEHPNLHYRLILLAQRAMAWAELDQLAHAREDLAGALETGLSGLTYQAYLDIGQAFVAGASVKGIDRRERAAALMHFDACCGAEEADRPELAGRFAHAYWRRLKDWKKDL